MRRCLRPRSVSSIPARSLRLRSWRENSRSRLSPRLTVSTSRSPTRFGGRSRGELRRRSLAALVLRGWLAREHRMGRIDRCRVRRGLRRVSRRLWRGLLRPYQAEGDQGDTRGPQQTTVAGGQSAWVGSKACSPGKPALSAHVATPRRAAPGSHSHRPRRAARKCAKVGTPGLSTTRKSGSTIVKKSETSIAATAVPGRIVYPRRPLGSRAAAMASLTEQLDEIRRGADRITG